MRRKEKLATVAALQGETRIPVEKHSLFERRGVAVCTQRQALCLAGFAFATLLTISSIIAFATPMTGCPSLDDDLANSSNASDLGSTPGPVELISKQGEVFPWNDIRLPDFIKPVRYALLIKPNLTTLEVKGTVEIYLTVKKNTSFIIMHSSNLTILSKDIWDKDKVVSITKHLDYVPFQQLCLKLDNPLQAGRNYTLRLEFLAKLSTELEGFYLSSYITKEKERRYLATTHFEPTYARSAFPCFDEPHLKATFKMSIVRERFHYALFNMPIEKTENYFFWGRNLMQDEFQESVEMSTYLVAFVVCDYSRKSGHTKRGVTVSVYTPPDQITQASFALDTAVKLMDYYEDFFGVAYPLPKEDLIAIPDFGVGAMENWGLITYRETSILYDPGESSAAAHQWVAIVVAHELAHQWFGNLVTMRWWNDLWLNEGFASFVEYFGVHHVMTEWRMLDQLILDKTQPALALDALTSSHPISVEVDDPKEIEAIFDTISYNKGAAILYMLEHVLGESVLRRGLTDYLNTHKFGSAETNDLWDALSRSRGTNDSFQVQDIMSTWTQQTGFPLITIKRENDTYYASQERFLLTWQLSNETQPVEESWFVPLSYITNENTHQIQYVWMNQTDAEFQVPQSVKWIKFNVNQTGFYRVMYDEASWKTLTDLLILNHTALSPADRASIIDDAFTLCRAGMINATIPLQMAWYLREETEYVPWATALGHLWGWAKYMYEEPAYRDIIRYICYLVQPIYDKIGWEDKGSHLDKLLRSDILSSAVNCENPHAIARAKGEFHNWKINHRKVPPNLREVVYSSGVKYGNIDEWEYCWSQYNQTMVSSEKKLLLKAMGMAVDPWLLTQYLEACLDRERIRPQDVRTVLAVVAANPHGRYLAWRHLRAHWSHLQLLFGHGSMTMGSLISSVVAHFATPFDFHEVSSFFENLDVGSAVRALQQSLELIQLNVHWLANNGEDINHWLKEHVPA